MAGTASVGRRLHTDGAAAGIKKPARAPAFKACTTVWRAHMADDKTKSGGQDRTRINTNEDYEVRDWSKKFGVSAEQLKAAVKAVGSNAKDVEAHLKGSKR